jgi:hypothetical protein
MIRKGRPEPPRGPLSFKGVCGPAEASNHAKGFLGPRSFDKAKVSAPGAASEMQLRMGYRKRSPAGTWVGETQWAVMPRRAVLGGDGLSNALRAAMMPRRPAVASGFATSRRGRNRSHRCGSRPRHGLCS